MVHISIDSTGAQIYPMMWRASENG